MAVTVQLRSGAQNKRLRSLFLCPYQKTQKNRQTAVPQYSNQFYLYLGLYSVLAGTSTLGLPL